MKKIFTYIILIITVSILFTGCITESYLPKKVNITEIAYNWLDDNIKSTIINWQSSKVEKKIIDTNHLVANGLETLDIVNKEVFKVTFSTEDDDLLGAVIVYLDTDTFEVLGMDFRD